MRILVVGSGGREHALAWKLAQSSSVTELIIAPGNGGTALMQARGAAVPVENVAVRANDIPALVELALSRKVDLVVAGPEEPLTLGLTDQLAEAGVPCFGPSAYAAQLEGSKQFAKDVMREAGVPTAAFAVFTDHAKARDYVAGTDGNLVIKADGLAAGKGVFVCSSTDEAHAALAEIMEAKAFGAAGASVIVEEKLTGQEASFLAFCDGENAALMPSAQDHKPVGEGDTGPNTGGMGAYSPAPILPASEYESMAEQVIRPIIRTMAERGHPFKGVLYAGLMLSPDRSVNVLEYNVRFGDPECQPLLTRFTGDLAKTMLACVEGTLDQAVAEGLVSWSEQTACCVVMAAGGYPASYARGMEITGLDAADGLDGVTVFHAGTGYEDGRVLASGGRVLGVTGLGNGLREARERAYAGVVEISFDTAYYRRDIGDKGLR